MNYQESNEECSGCGATSEDRRRNRPGDPQGLSECPHCGGSKCCMCDMGDEVECSGCGDSGD